MYLDRQNEKHEAGSPRWVTSRVKSLLNNEVRKTLDGKPCANYKPNQKFVAGSPNPFS